MKKLIVPSLAIAGLLFFTQAYAGFGENKWHFEKEEVVVLDITDPDRPDGNGYFFGCEKFIPSGVSFTVTYQIIPGIKHPLWVKADRPDKVKHDEVNHIYTITDAKTLELGFPPEGLYHITNTTGGSVTGTQCSAGLYG